MAVPARALALTIGALALLATTLVPLSSATADDGPSTMLLEGTLLTAVTEYSDSAATDAAVVTSSEVTQYAVQTDSGIVPVSGDALPEDAASGDSFSGTVEIPDAVIAALPDDVAAAVTSSAEPLESNSSEAQAVQAASSDSDEPFAVQSSEVTPEPVSSAAYVAQTFYVAVVTPSDASAATEYTDDQAKAVASQVAGYWVNQSEGTIPSIATYGTVQRYTSTYTCASSSLYSRWTEAANRFFPNGPSNAFTDGTGRHLILLMPKYCAPTSGVGVGTVGATVNRGGFTQVVVGDGVDFNALAHEIGHNFGLQHSNLDYCAKASTVNGCTEYEYYDLYDVMGVSVRGTTILPALNSASKVKLGFIPVSAVTTVQLAANQASGSFTYTLSALGGRTGTRVLSIVDPFTSEVRYVEYRAGSGDDAGAYYTGNPGLNAANMASRSRAGVRMLRVNTVGGTADYSQWDDACGCAYTSAVVGQALNTYDTAVKVTFVSGNASSGATVRVDLTRVTPAPNAQPVYRFWSPRNKTHFYTISLSERDSVIADYDDDIWTYEGVAYTAYTTPVPGSRPVFRFFSNAFQGHFYTISTGERDRTINDYDDNTWLYENIAFFVYPASNTSAGLTSVYRFWSPDNRHHFYTASPTERDRTINNYQDHEWTYEIEAFKVPAS